ASFDRFDRNITEAEKGARSKEGSGVAKEELIRIGLTKPVPLKEGEECATKTRTVAKSGVPTASENTAGDPGCAEDVRVGDVVLKLRKRVEQA
ncbi:hypothetical protein A2U01_0078130, partial [Trifolium medium]|nr:hypothetical protein [Trifolium medium]